MPDDAELEEGLLFPEWPIFEPFSGRTLPEFGRNSTMMAVCRERGERSSLITWGGRGNKDGGRKGRGGEEFWTMVTTDAEVKGSTSSPPSVQHRHFFRSCGGKLESLLQSLFL